MEVYISKIWEVCGVPPNHIGDIAVKWRVTSNTYDPTYDSWLYRFYCIFESWDFNQVSNSKKEDIKKEYKTKCGPKEL